MFLATFDSNVNIKKIYEIKYILHTVVVLNLFLNIKIVRHLDTPRISPAKWQNELNAVVSTKPSSAKNQLQKNQNAVTVAKAIRQTTEDVLLQKSFKAFVTKP